MLLPVSYETDFLFSGYLSFLWKIDLLENKIILYRNGLPEFEFVKEGNNYYCKETGEIIFSEVIDNVNEFRIKDGTLSYFLIDQNLMMENSSMLKELNLKMVLKYLSILII